MRPETLSKYIDTVVVLDLVMGREITTRIKSVDTDAGVLVCTKPRVFVPVPNPQNQQEAMVITLHYGHPMYQADEELEIECGHVFTVFKPNEEQIDAYTREVSGIVKAQPGALNQLDHMAKTSPGGLII